MFAKGIIAGNIFEVMSHTSYEFIFISKLVGFWYNTKNETDETKIKEKPLENQLSYYEPATVNRGIEKVYFKLKIKKL